MLCVPGDATSTLGRYKSEQIRKAHSPLARSSTHVHHCPSSHGPCHRPSGTWLSLPITSASPTNASTSRARQKPSTAVAQQLPHMLSILENMPLETLELQGKTQHSLTPLLRCRCFAFTWRPLARPTQHARHEPKAQSRKTTEPQSHRASDPQIHRTTKPRKATRPRSQRTPEPQNPSVPKHQSPRGPPSGTLGLRTSGSEFFAHRMRKVFVWVFFFGDCRCF